MRHFFLMHPNDTIIKRTENGKCSYKQSKTLQHKGLPTDKNFMEASKAEKVTCEGRQRDIAVVNGG